MLEDEEQQWFQWQNGNSLATTKGV